MAYSLSSEPYEPDEDTLEELMAEDEVEIEDEEFEEIDESPEEDDSNQEYEEDQTYDIELDGKVHKLTREQLSDVVSGKSKSFDDDPEFQEFKQLKPVIDTIRKDNAMKDYLRYKANGHSEDQIIDGMFLLRHPELQGVIQNHYAGRQQQRPEPQEEEMPEFDTVQEQIEWITNKTVQQKLNQALGQFVPSMQQLQQQQQQMQQQSALSYVRENNNSVMEDALYESGYNADQMSEDDLREMARTMEDLYPNVNFKTATLNPSQAKRVVKAALGAMSNKTFNTQQYIKQAKLPSIKPTGASRKGNSKRGTFDKIDGLSKSQRIERLNKLW